jgi:hypothetical protein
MAISECRSFSRIKMLALGAVLAASPFWSMPSAAQNQAGQRTVSGTVTDGHEPLGGAIVQLQNPGNNSIVSYITDANGGYHFKRLDGQTDFTIWAMFRGHRSAVRSISKFDSHMNKVINFTVKTY